MVMMLWFCWLIVVWFLFVDRCLIVVILMFVVVLVWRVWFVLVNLFVCDLLVVLFVV